MGNAMNGVEQILQDEQVWKFLDNLAPPLQLALLLGSLVLLPAALAALTCFTRVVIVLSFIRRGMSTQEIPPNSVLLGLALFLTFFMGPTLDRISSEAIKPYLDEQMKGVDAIQKGLSIHKEFMLRHTRKHDLSLFLHISESEPPQTRYDTPFRVLIPAFIVSELKTGFLMGFCIFIPFLLVDLVVATVLMSMGMWMMPPIIVSTPFKVLLFVLADGWHLIALTITQSYG